MNFRTKILRAGKTATGIEFPTSVVEALGAGKRPPVRVTINGYTYRSTVAVRSRTFPRICSQLRRTWSRPTNDRAGWTGVSLR